MINLRLSKGCSNCKFSGKGSENSEISRCEYPDHQFVEELLCDLVCDDWKPCDWLKALIDQGYYNRFLIKYGAKVNVS